MRQDSHKNGPGLTVRSLALAFSAWVAAASGAAAQNKVQVYPVPSALLYSAHNDDYTVRVREPGGA